MHRPMLTTADGMQLRARRWLTEETPAGGAPQAAVVVVHGFSASSECPHVEALGGDLQAAGLDVISYDARGHGRSSGESTLGDRERYDVAAAVALARQRTDRVALVGASMGAIAALRYAVTDPALAGLVAVSCPARWRLPRNPRGVLAALMTRTPVGRRLTTRMCGVRVAPSWTNPVPPIDLVPALRVPVAFVHGTRDRFVSPADAWMLHRAAPEPRQLTLVPGMGHAFEPLAVAPVRDALAWVLAHVRV